MVGRAPYPLTWQVMAARRHAARIGPERFGALLQMDPGCVRALVAEQPDVSVINGIGAALKRIEPAVARHVLRACSGRVPIHVEQAWWDAVSSRLTPLEAFGLVAERARLLGDVEDGRAVGAFARAADHALRNHSAPPSFDVLQRVFDNTASATERTWRGVTNAFTELNGTSFVSVAVRRTLDEIRNLRDRHHQQIVSDLLLCHILATESSRAFEQGMTGVEQCHGLPAAAEMLLRAATDLPTLTAPTMTRLLRWGVRAINRSAAPKHVAAALDSDQVRDMVAQTGCDVPKELRDRHHSKIARRWIDHVTADLRHTWRRSPFDR